MTTKHNKDAVERAIAAIDATLAAHKAARGMVPDEEEGLAAQVFCYHINATDGPLIEAREALARQATEQVSDDAEAIARLFHETYEELAPSFSYETRKASAVPWEQVPENNRKLMIAVAGRVRQALASTPAISEAVIGALQFYANRKGYDNSGPSKWFPLSEDEGKVARAALATLNQPVSKGARE